MVPIARINKEVKTNTFQDQKEIVARRGSAERKAAERQNASGREVVVEELEVGTGQKETAIVNEAEEASTVAK